MSDLEAMGADLSVKTSAFDYLLPPHLIAQCTMEPRDHSRMMVLRRQDGSTEHRHFYDLADYLTEGDILVCNESKVVPARLKGHKMETGGKVELLLVRQVSEDTWEVLAKPGRRAKVGANIRIEAQPTGQNDLETPAISPVVGAIVGKTESGRRLVRFPTDGGQPIIRWATLPIPPYIRRPVADPRCYQTVYARVDGSIAAPTAGLHFTPQLMDRLQRQGIQITFLTMHIGPGTFRPIKEEDPQQHRMDAEYGEAPPEVVDLLNRGRAEGRRIVAVGTSTVRLLETAGKESSKIGPFAGWTDLFITPGYRFQAVDAIITNFHLPRSTPLLLTCAFAGKELIHRAYQEAIGQEYRFYSFGDAMLIL